MKAASRLKAHLGSDSPQVFVEKMLPGNAGSVVAVMGVETGPRFPSIFDASRRPHLVYIRKNFVCGVNRDHWS